MTLKSVLVLKEAIFVFFELLLGCYRRSSVAPEVSCIVKVYIKVVHSCGTAIAINAASIDINIRLNIESNDSAPN